MAKSLVNKLGTKKRDLQLFSKKKQNKLMKSKNDPDLRTEDKSSRCGRRNGTWVLTEAGIGELLADVLHV